MNSEEKKLYGVFQPLYQDQDTDGAGIRQRSLPTAQGSRRKQQGLALGQCPSPLGRRL